MVEAVTSNDVDNMISCVLCRVTQRTPGGRYRGGPTCP
jgi:hypothetical protein